MDVKITPKKLSGKIEAISSKSYAQRIIIASALCKGTTKINLRDISDDINASLSAVKAMGADVSISDGHVLISGIEDSLKDEYKEIFCKESGTCARLILPVAIAKFRNGMLCGEGSLLNRGFDELCDAIREKGVNISQNRLPISWKGEMANGRYEITGGKSSQFISGLMFALPLLCGDSEIVLTSPLQSSGYVDITIETLGKFGIQSGYRIKGNQQYISPGEIDVEGDWSNSAYFLCADVEVSGLCENSLQKDSIFSKVKDQDEIDVSEIPDLVPILAVYAATREKKVVFKNIERLRLKESDRVKSVSEMLISLGASVSSDESTMTIESSGLTGGEVDSFNDHRIVMSAAIASCYCKNEVVIKNAQAVNKSYPEFFNHFNKLGGCAYVI